MADPLSRLQTALADRYTIERELGHGGTATVYLADDVKHARRVALKVLRPEVGAALGAERFLREIQIAARLTHPHILPLHDSGAAEEFLYYVMPYVEGESLRDRLNREKQLPLEGALQIAREVADALSYAHSHDAVHRDIKPENILLEAGHAVVADFGIARAITAAGGKQLTETGIAVGTPAYMSPEQAAGERETDGRSDIYSLGCVLFEMLAGDPPFTGPSAQAVIARHALDPVPRLRTVRGAVPATLERTITKALAKVPADRFATAADFARALAEEAGMIDSRRAATSARPAATAVPSIAVLPFANISADPGNEYFSDGMTEEIINALTAVGSLRVAARTSSFAFKGKTQDIRTIGEQLNVGTVLEGSVRKAGSRLRITAQLVNVADGYHLWSARYDREMEDVFTIQDEIATAIVGTLKIKLLGAARAPLARRHTENIEAYEMYLKGRYFWNQRGEGLRRGLDYFQRALERDPHYALAHAGLADAYNLLGYYCYLPPNEAFPKAKVAARRALALDESLAEPHASLGFVALFHDWEWPTAQREFERAIELDPAYAPARYWLALYYLMFRRFEECAAEVERALEIEPLSAPANTVLGWFLYYAGRYPEAVVQLPRVLELNPNFFLAHNILGHSYLLMSHFDDAIAEFQQAVTLSSRNPWAVASLGYACALCGRRAEAEDLLAELQERSSREYVPSALVACVYAALGERDKGLDCLEQAYEARDVWTTTLGVEPAYDALRSDPRFTVLVRKVLGMTL